MSISRWFVHYSTAAVKDVKNAFAALHLAWERGHSIRKPSRVKYGKEGRQSSLVITPHTL